MTKIKYTKERLRSNLRIGVFFIAIGIFLILLSFVTGEWKNISLKSIGIGEIGAGIFLLLIYYFEYKWQYLTLKNNVLIKNTLIPKKIKLSEIKSIQEFAGDLKLVMGEKEFIINTQIIETSSMSELKSELKKLNVEWN